ncbi:FkbM family methyltransferase [Candidatus Omnitrophota bacterium]
MKNNDILNRLCRSIINTLLFLPGRFTKDILLYLLKYAGEGVIRSRYGFNIYYRPGRSHENKRKRDIILGWYEDKELKFIKQFIRRGDYVIDCGAFEGYFSLYMSHVVGKDGRVFSIEPNKENLHVLRDNIICNKPGNIEVIERAVSNERTEMDFYYRSDSGSGGALVKYPHFRDVNSLRVEVDTLDNLFKDLRHDIKFIKLDLEGNEYNALLGAQDILSRHKPYLSFELNLTFWAYHDVSVSKFFDYLKGLDYKCYIPRDGKLIPLGFLGKRISNIFAVHRSRES